MSSSMCCNVRSFGRILFLDERLFLENSSISAEFDGLLHVTDMSWGRVQNPGELFRVGDSVQVKVLKFDRERERVSLGYKQLLPDPCPALKSASQLAPGSTGEWRALPTMEHLWSWSRR